MARPVSIDDDAILNAAREVFLAHGIRGTTAEVAHKAGISEGSIFRRWKTKEELFRAAMQGSVEQHDNFTSHLMDRVGKGDLHEQLVEVGLQGAMLFERIVPLQIHAFAHGSEQGQTWGPGEPPPLVGRRRLASYFEAERHAGRLRQDVDTEVLARTFIGALYNFVSLEFLLRGHERQPMPVATYVRGLVDQLLRGVAAPAAPAAPKSRR